MIDYENELAILSTAFTSKGSKNLSYDEYKFNELVENNLSSTNKTLYRGISIKELLEHKLTKGSTICFSRVTSFTEDFSLADSFSLHEYETGVILKIEGCEGVFNYSGYTSFIIDTVKGGCRDYKDHERFDYLNDQMNMVEEEKEWMFPIGSEFNVIDIEHKSSNYPSKESSKVIITIRSISGNIISKD